MITKRRIEEPSTRLLSVGTTIITARGKVGKCALAGNPMAMNQSCYGIRGKEEHGDYFTYFAFRNLVSELQNLAAICDALLPKSLLGEICVNPSSIL